MGYKALAFGLKVMNRLEYTVNKPKYQLPNYISLFSWFAITCGSRDIPSSATNTGTDHLGWLTICVGPVPVQKQ